MKKAKNTFSILAVVFGILSPALFLLIPIISNWFKLAPEFAEKVPTVTLTLDFLKDFINVKNINFSFGSFLLGDWIRFTSYVIVAIALLCAIVWLVLIIVKKKPSQLGLWFIVLIGVICAVIGVNLQATRFALVDGVEGKFNFAVSSAPETSEDWLLVMVALNSILPETKLIEPLNNVAAIMDLVAAAFGVIALLLSVFAFAFSIKWLASEKVNKRKATKTNKTKPVSNVKDVKVEDAFRYIVIDKDNKVLKVFNGNLQDVTDFLSPRRKNKKSKETEERHYQKLMNEKKVVVRKVVQVVKAEPVVEKKVPEKVEQAPTYERISFTKRMKSASSDIKNNYNELKSEIMSYGVKSRVAAGGDTFRLHTKTYVKMTIAGKGLKLYLALDPKDYKGTTIPFDDASNKNMYKEIPFVFKVKSELSMRRAKQLIAEAMLKDKLRQTKVNKHDWVKDL